MFTHPCPMEHSHTCPELCSRVNGQLGVNPGQRAIDALRAQNHRLRDLSIRQSCRRQPCDLELGRRQLVHRRRRRTDAPQLAASQVHPARRPRSLEHLERPPDRIRGRPLLALPPAQPTEVKKGATELDRHWEIVVMGDNLLERRHGLLHIALRRAQQRPRPPRNRPSPRRRSALDGGLEAGRGNRGIVKAAGEHE